jgi:hypothetical protein
MLAVTELAIVAELVAVVVFEVVTVLVEVVGVVVFEVVTVLVEVVGVVVFEVVTVLVEVVGVVVFEVVTVMVVLLVVVFVVSVMGVKAEAAKALEIPLSLTESMRETTGGVTTAKRPHCKRNSRLWAFSLSSS